MAMRVDEIKDWLNTLNDDDLVGVDDDGLALQLLGDEDTYCEIGGLPGDEEGGYF